MHCLHHEIIGSWKFVLGRPSGTRSSCGHLRPDSVDVQPGRDVLDAVDRDTRPENEKQTPGCSGMYVLNRIRIHTHDCADVHMQMLMLYMYNL